MFWPIVHAGRDFPFDLPSDGPFCDLQVILGLKIDPEVGRSTKIACKPHRRISSHGAPPSDNVVDARARHFKRARKFIHAYTQRSKEFIPQDFPGMDGREPSSRRNVGKIHELSFNCVARNAHVQLFSDSRQFQRPMHAHRAMKNKCATGRSREYYTDPRGRRGAVPADYLVES